MADTNERVAFWGWNGDAGENATETVGFWGWVLDVVPTPHVRGLWPFAWPTLTPFVGRLPWPSLLSQPDQTV